MGLELILGGIGAIINVFSGMAQANATKQAANAQKEANKVQAAQQEVQSTESRRQRVREARIRRAQIIAASENQGTSGSSGAVGAVGALSSNLSGMFSSSLGDSKANAGINTNLQKAADYTANANAIGAWANVFSSGISGFQSIFSK
jgi:hypothetical protein